MAKRAIVRGVLLGVEVRRQARDALLVCVAAMISDRIGGLYGISALIGFACSCFLIRESGSRTS
jgi:hypothetical protein